MQLLALLSGPWGLRKGLGGEGRRGPELTQSLAMSEASRHTVGSCGLRTGISINLVQFKLTMGTGRGICVESSAGQHPHHISPGGSSVTLITASLPSLCTHLSLLPTYIPALRASTWWDMQPQYPFECPIGDWSCRVKSIPRDTLLSWHSLKYHCVSCLFILGRFVSFCYVIVGCAVEAQKLIMFFGFSDFSFLAHFPASRYVRSRESQAEFALHSYLHFQDLSWKCLRTGSKKLDSGVGAQSLYWCCHPNIWVSMSDPPSHQ